MKPTASDIRSTLKLLSGVDYMREDLVRFVLIVDNKSGTIIRYGNENEYYNPSSGLIMGALYISDNDSEIYGYISRLKYRRCICFTLGTETKPFNFHIVMHGDDDGGEATVGCVSADGDIISITSRRGGSMSSHEVTVGNCDYCISLIIFHLSTNSYSVRLCIERSHVMPEHDSSGSILID